MKALYTFRWNEGGFNQVWANNKAEAIKEINQTFCRMLSDLTPNLKSLKRVASKKAQESYFANIPFMD